MKIIGLCGFKGSGKSTVSNTAINIRRTAYPFKRIGFSDPLYRMLVTMGLPEDLVYDKTKWDDEQSLLCGRTIRHACDTLGTEWGQYFIAKEVWANMAIARCEDFTIIDNVRFPHEKDAITAAGGTIIAFKRIGHDLTPAPADIHIAEIQKRCEYRFYNSGDQLELNASELLNLLIDICDNWP